MGAMIITDEMIVDISSKLDKIFPYVPNTSIETWKDKVAEMMFISKSKVHNISACINRNNGLRNEFYLKCETLLPKV